MRRNPVDLWDRYWHRYNCSRQITNPINMKTIAIIARILLGLIFLIFGLNGFYTFIPVPEFHPFMELMVSSGFIYFVKAIEVIAGVLLLSNRYVLAAILLLGPIVVNISLFHLLIDERNWPITIIILPLYIILFLKNFNYFKIFLQPKVQS